MHRRRRQHRDERGAAAVELALVLPILVLLVGGIIDFGLALNGQISLTHAAREGVRVEALDIGDGAQAATDAFAAPAMGAPTASVAEACNGAGARARVVIQANYDSFFLPFLNSSLEGQAVMRCGG